MRRAFFVVILTLVFGFGFGFVLVWSRFKLVFYHTRFSPSLMNNHHVSHTISFASLNQILYNVSSYLDYLLGD